MESERWRRVEALYQAALEHEPSARATFLEEMCAGDETLRNEVESLLEHGNALHAFFDAPAEELATEAQTDAPPLIGTRLGAYQIAGLLGGGGMGRVYRARDTRLGREVAIKILNHQFSDRFEREARAISALNHPHICTLYDVGQQDGRSFLVMEYLAGETLATHLGGGPLPWEVALQYGIQIMDGLMEAHRSGVVHRDLKPSNVMLTRSGVKIVDFGVAKLIAPVSASDSFLSTAHDETVPGSIVGTLAYMAPEQLEGRPVDPRADVFSFGAVLYEMLTGTPPFQGQSNANLIAAVLEHRPRPPARVVPGVPIELSNLVLRCLAKSRVGRPTSDAVASQLHALAPAPQGTRRLPAARHGRQRIRALAVLPILTTLKTDAGDAFSEGITEGLITALRAFPALRVISPQSSMRYKSASSKPIPEIANELKVDALLMGSVTERASGVLSLDLELVEGANEGRLWSDSTQFDWRDVLGVLEQVAHAVAQRILGRAVPKPRPLAKRLVSREGHEAYLRGRFLFDNRVGNWLTVSFDALQSAIAHDRQFAPAHAALSRWFIAAALRAMAIDPGPGANTEHRRESLRKAEDEARYAVLLDSTLAEAHAALGQVMLLQWRFVDAEAAYVRSLELNPNAPQTHAGYSEFLNILGRPVEAIEHADIAKHLDPLATYVYEAAAEAFYVARRFRECIEVALAGLELTPRAGVLWYFKGLAEAFAGDLDEAVASLKRSNEIMSSHHSTRAGLGVALAKSGNALAASELLESLAQDDEPLGVAEVCAALDRTSEALDWLETDFERHSPNVVGIGADPVFDRLRNHPRFERLLRGIGLPPSGSRGELGPTP